MSVCAVVGGQFGSEGKGLIVGEIAREYDHHVRVGAANAGHTLYTNSADPDQTQRWEKHVMQQVPCAAYANPDAKLYIGPGALISPEIFARELGILNGWRSQKGQPVATVYVDARAHVITDQQIEEEQQSDLAERIGSTSATAREGIGTAQSARVMRDSGCLTAEVYFGTCPHESVEIRDVPAMLQGVDRILLEGTQGAGLSLTTGAFPYVTSRNTTSAGLAADCGVAPNRLDRIVLVCRTFPIRVAGNSGPFWADSKEISWSDLGIDEENERTTVTKKVRRVATFSMAQVEEACALNGATEIALTFTDYLAPDLAGRTERGDARQSSDVWDLVVDIEQVTGVPVTTIGTGPHSIIDIKDGS